MLHRPSPLVVLAASAAACSACVSQAPVPLRDGTFPRGAVQVGEAVRVTTRGGESLHFTVAGVEGGVLTGAGGERVEVGDLASLEVRRADRRRTIVAVSVLGGVVGTAVLIDALRDDIDDCFDDIFDSDCD